MLKSQVTAPVFCQNCFNHIHQAKTILDECQYTPCSSEHYERIGYQFTALMSEARSSRLDVLANYAQAMASYIRCLHNKSPQQISQSDWELMRTGIDMALDCQQGMLQNKCVGNNFDLFWPLITELRARAERQA